MAAIISAANGNWSAASSWSGGVAPGAGDTVSISHHILFDVSGPVGAGNGPYAAGTNPAAIETTGLGTLTVAPGVSLTIRGDLRYNNTVGATGWALTLLAGASYSFDSSTTAPVTTAYRAFPATSQIYMAGIRTLGTSSARCTVTSNAAGANGSFSSAGQTDVMSYDCSYTDFSNLGAATASAMDVSFYAGFINLSFFNCSFNACGAITHITVGSTNSPASTFTGCVFENSLNTSYNIYSLQGGWYSDCVFDMPFGPSGFAGSSFSGNYFGQGVTSGGNSDVCAFWDNNFVHAIGQTLTPQSALIRNTIWMKEPPPTTDPSTPETGNPHYLINNTNFPQTFEGNIFEYTGGDGSGDSISFINGGSGFHYVMRNNIVLPNAEWDDSGTLFSLTGSFNGNTIEAQHNTFYAGSQGATFSENGANTPGTITLFKNNVGWDYYPSDPYSGASAYRGFLLRDIGGLSSSSGLQTDVVSPANADFNCAFALNPSNGNSWLTNQGKAYQGAYSATPGAHDIDLNFSSTATPTPGFSWQHPGFNNFFVNQTVLWDTQYLGTSAAPEWHTFTVGTTLSVGTLCSCSASGIYGGFTPVNYRLIKPLVVDNIGFSYYAPGQIGLDTWRQYWEPASLYDIRQAIVNGNTYTDATLGVTNADVITTLRTWITHQLMPSPSLSAAILNAGSDGQNIGILGTQPSIQLAGQGIPSAEAFGTTSLGAAPAFLAVSGIPSAETFGTVSVSITSATLQPTGIGSAEAFGTLVFAPGSAPTFSLSGVASAEAFGTLILSAAPPTFLAAYGIPSAEAFGVPSLQLGLGIFELTGIPSAEAFGNVQISTAATAANFYLSLLTSEYQLSSRLIDWLAEALDPVSDIQACLSTFAGGFDLSTAVGSQLDILGQIIGQSRLVGFQPSDGVSPELDDTTYRLLLNARIAQNNWNGSIDGLQAVWQNLFPGGRITISDSQNMTVNIILSGAFTSIIQDLIVNGYIVPRPEGVLYNYNFSALPIFGFDSNTSLIAGFDTGHWS